MSMGEYAGDVPVKVYKSGYREIFITRYYPPDYLLKLDDFGGNIPSVASTVCGYDVTDTELVYDQRGLKEIIITVKV